MASSKRSGATAEIPVITDFAITTINVPDRLDAQEVRARAEAEEDSPRPDRFDFGAVVKWLTWIVVAAGLFGLIFFAYASLAPYRAQISREGVAARLSQALSRPVVVETSEIRLAPYPRLVIEGVNVGEDIRLGQVSLRFSWSSVARAVRGGGWIWGEATVESADLSPTGVFHLLRTLPALSNTIPVSIPKVKFEAVSFPGSPLLRGRYEVVAERAGDSVFSTLTVSELDIPGAMELLVDGSGTSPAKFKLRARQWRSPIGPRVEWSEAGAEGSFAAGKLQVDRFSANAFFGVLTGTLQISRASTWTVSGSFQGSNFDLGAIRQYLAKRSKSPGDLKAGPALQGTVETSGTFGGRGSALADAFERLGAAGRAQVRFAALSGINLGLAATQGVSGEGGGGTTRFSDLDAAFTVSGGTVNVRDIAGRAGALIVTGALGIEDDLSLRGILRAEISSARGQLPIDVPVSGSVLQPSFGFSGGN